MSRCKDRSALGKQCYGGTSLLCVLSPLCNCLLLQVKADAKRKGTLLPENDANVQLVRRVGLRIVEQTKDGLGEGAQSHMQVQL